MGKNKLIIKQQEEPEEKQEEVKEEIKEEVKPTPKKPNKTAETLKGIAGGTKLVYVLDKKNLPFILYLALIGILYISNTYYTSGTLRQIEKVKVQIKELRYEYVSTRKQLIESSRRNKVIERLKWDSKELKESKVPPYKMEVQDQSIKQ